MEMHARSSLVVLWLHFYCVSGKSQVEQSPPALVVLEGENCTFQCNYTVSPVNNLRWYTQDPGRGPVSLITMTYSDNKKSNGWYTATMDATAKLSPLHLTAAQLGDPAFYICVVGAPCSPGTRTLYPNPHLEVVKEQFLKCCV
ncbi:hypothetical protein FD755_023816 [Muntiacus reevesi]|uniref:Ig-like domain-containing protein n=1 Tax=Muntiacus reevesi TaxID=9886 RepID=A0A5N3VX00_MUNRE|nr:hypothetical protein FD755_023816 [Muntiacus reevesi]